MLNTIGMIITLVVVVWAGWMIARKGYAAATLLVAGIILLTSASIMYSTQPTDFFLDGMHGGIAAKLVKVDKKKAIDPATKKIDAAKMAKLMTDVTAQNAKSLRAGWTKQAYDKASNTWDWAAIFFTIYGVVQSLFKSTLGGLGLNIMIMGGFACYMDKLSAGRALYDVVGGPLKYIKSPYLLACMGLVVTQIIGMAIPSAAALGLMLMVTLYPVMIRAGVPRMTAVCIVAASRFFDLGPGSANCMMTAQVSGIEWAEYFINYQMVIYPFLLATMLVSMYFCQKYWDAKEGVDPDEAELRKKFQSEAVEATPVPKIYAILPMVPLIILLVFNKTVMGLDGMKSFMAMIGVHKTVTVGVPAAIVASTMIAMLFDVIRCRSAKKVCGDLKDFFQGMGKQFAVVVSLIVAGQVLGQGLIAIGAVHTMIEGCVSAGLGAGFLTVAMCLVIGIVSLMMGSGNAPFFSFAPLIPAIAAKFNVPTVEMLLPMQTMTGLGRTMSPVTGAIVAVSGMAGVSPFRVIKRNIIPLLLTTVVNFIVCFTFFL